MISECPQVVVLVGGLGTRLAGAAGDVPKPMVDIAGRPILERQLRWLAGQGITRVTLLAGHGAAAIKEHFGDGASLGLIIEYLVETTPLGTGGALSLLPNEGPDEVIVLNGDVLFDVDIARFLAFHRMCGGKGTVMVHPNDHPYDSALLELGDDQRVREIWRKGERVGWFPNLVNAGLHVFARSIIADLRPHSFPVDLDDLVLHPLIARGELFGYASAEYAKDMGTPERLAAVRTDVERSVPSIRRVATPRRAVFMDRDGTINKLAGYVTDPNQFELLPGAADLVRLANTLGYLVIVVTNQPAIARGELDWSGLRRIHNKMETLLGAEGAYVDSIFVCPHHPHSGFPGERSEYKTECLCRKPKPGMLRAAADEFNLDLSRSYMVGDSDRDRGVAMSAGCVFYDVDDMSAVLMRESSSGHVSSQSGVAR